MVMGGYQRKGNQAEGEEMPKKQSRESIHLQLSS